jgi:hypothetical protein
MSGANVPQPPDPDDWFAEPGGRRAAQNRVDEWLAEGAAVRRRPRPTLPVSAGSLIATAIVVVVLVVVGLAVGGVFSSSSKHPATTPPTSPTTTTTPTTTAPPASQPVGPTATLKPGDKGAQVKRLQRALAQLGYYSAKSVDGDYGPATENAVKLFQQAAKLTADGIVGPKTLRALRTALKTG